MEAKDRMQAIVESYVEAYNAFDVPGMLLHLHEQVVFKNISSGLVNLEIHGKTAFEAQARQACSYFSERRQIINSLTFPEAQVAEITIGYHATLAMDFPNGMKRGEQLALSGKSRFCFQNDQIIDIEDIS